MKLHTAESVQFVRYSKARLSWGFCLSMPPVNVQSRSLAEALDENSAQRSPVQQEVAVEPAVIPSRSVRKVSRHRGCCRACRLSLISYNVTQ